MITIELYGDPVPLSRPRFSKRGKFVKCYDSQKDIKEKFRWQIRSQFRDSPLTIPLCIDLVFFLPIPESTSKVKRKAMLHGTLLHMAKPDIDNLIKFILDCMNELAFEDDKQVIEIRAKKIYSEKPGTLVRMIPLTSISAGLLDENCARNG